MYEIDWSPRARRQLTKLGERRDRMAVVEAVGGLVQFPALPGLERLRSHRFGWRLRVGRFRVLFDVDSEQRLVIVQEVLRRDERTY